MTFKSYAFFDLLGVKNAFADGTAAQLLEKFWNTADAWTSSPHFPAMKVYGESFLTQPTVFVRTFSDSAILYTKEEHSIEDFYLIVESFKSSIERGVGKVYVIVSRNKEASAPRMPALGGRMLDHDMTPNYLNIAGSGDAWANIHYADHVITRTKEWHETYTFFCVGEQSKPKDFNVKDTRECMTINGKTIIFALC